MTSSEFISAQSKLGLNNYQIAEKLGVSVSLVEKIRQGATPVRKPLEMLINHILQEQNQ